MVMSGLNVQAFEINTEIDLTRASSITKDMFCFCA